MVEPGKLQGSPDGDAQATKWAHVRQADMGGPVRGDLGIASDDQT
jgi:hypothetical protein